MYEMDLMGFAMYKWLCGVWTFNRKAAVTVTYIVYL